MPVNARCTPLSVRRMPALSGGGFVFSAAISLLGAFVAFAPLPDAAMDDLLEMIAAREPADLDVRIRSRASPLINIASSWPTW